MFIYYPFLYILSKIIDLFLKSRNSFTSYVFRIASYVLCRSYCILRLMSFVLYLTSYVFRIVSYVLFRSRDRHDSHPRIHRVRIGCTRNPSRQLRLHLRKHQALLKRYEVAAHARTHINCCNYARGICESARRAYRICP